MGNKLNLLVRTTSLFLVVAMAGWQNPPLTERQKTMSLNEQYNQLASVVAATKYLKYKCSRSDLPADSVIMKTANRVAVQKGWHSLSTEELVKHSDDIYHRLTKDSTQEQIKCNDFNRQLRKFINEL